MQLKKYLLIPIYKKIKIIPENNLGIKIPSLYSLTSWGIHLLVLYLDMEDWQAVENKRAKEISLPLSEISNLHTVSWQIFGGPIGWHSVKRHDISAF